MKIQKLTISQTQKIALRLLEDPQVVTLLFGGGAGGAKSVIVCLWMIIQCHQYPGIRIGLGRKELKRLKETTVVTLLQKAHRYLGVEEQEYKYNAQSGIITYINGSSIQLVDMAYQPSDPEYDTFGSLEFTHVVIEEVGEIPEKAVDVLSSRKDRFLNKEYGIVGKTAMTCNPTQNFIRKRFYEVYKALGGGRYQTWELGRVELSDGSIVPAKLAFVHSLARDNPFISRNFLENLRSKPPSIRKRLLDGDWDYLEDNDLLMPTTLIDRAMTGLLPNIDNPPKGIGADIADKGIDKTVLSYVENFVLKHQKVVDIDKSEGAEPIGKQIALAIIRYAQERGVTARNVAFDCVGVGASTRDQLRDRGWNCIEYDAGAAPTEPGYYKLGSQAAWGMREDMDADKFKIHRELQTLENLRTEMLAHPYDDDPVIRVRKDKAKEELGHSPDYFDSAVMARWACLAEIEENYGIAW